MSKLTAVTKPSALKTLRTSSSSASGGKPWTRTRTPAGRWIDRDGGAGSDRRNDWSAAAGVWDEGGDGKLVGVLDDCMPLHDGTTGGGMLVAMGWLASGSDGGGGRAGGCIVNDATGPGGGGSDGWGPETGRGCGIACIGGGGMTGLTSVERLGEAWTEQSALAAQVGEAQVGVAEVGVGYP